MEEKKYEAGKVEISSAEYRDLVKEAVEARRDASEIRSEKWRLETELRECKEKLGNCCKENEDLRRRLAQIYEARALANIEINKYTNMAEGAN